MRRGSLRIALDEVIQHPLRTFLICQGMLWAVAVTIIPASVIQGSRDQAVERARELGTDRVEVSVDRTQGLSVVPREQDLKGVRERLDPDTLLTALRVERAAAPELKLPTVWLLGCDPSLPETRGVRVLEGEFPGPTPGPDGVLGVALEENLAALVAPEGSPVGRILYLERRPGRSVPLLSLTPSTGGGPSRRLRVLGVVEDQTRSRVDRFGNKEGSLFAEDIADLARMLGVMTPDTPWLKVGLGIYLPRSAVPGDHLDWLYLRGDPRRVEEISDNVQKALVEAGRTPLVFTNTLWAIMTKPELDGYLALHDSLSWVFLIIGLIVLANLLLLSGWRRRREIALRRTEGASRADIFAQFLGEGLCVGVLGLVAGIIAGMLLAWLRVSLDPNIVMAVGWPWATIRHSAIVLTCGALLASSYPAWKASGHQPMTLFRKAD